MTAASHFYRGEEDFPALLDFLSRATLADSGAGYLHPGDLTWWLRQNNALKPQQSIKLFAEGDTLLGFTFSDPATWAVIQALPGLPITLLDQMLEHVEQRAGDHKPELVVWAFEGDKSLVAALERKSYRRGGEGTCQLEHQPVAGSVIDLEIQFPEGYSFTAISDEPQIKRERVELHRAVWNPSRVTLDAYEHLRAASSYDMTLDVVLRTLGGQFAAYALGWYDAQTKLGIMEPVGVHPEYRRRGLGKLVVHEVTRRLTALGARRISIRTPQSNRAAVGLYISVGYKVTGRLWDYSV